jgi:hypothetical protein
MNITAKVKSVRKESMTVQFSYAVVDGFVEFGKTEEELRKMNEETVKASFKGLADRLSDLGLSQSDIDLLCFLKLKDQSFNPVPALIASYEMKYPGVAALQNEILDCQKKFNGQAR